MASLARRASKNPEFVRVVVGLLGAARPSINQIDEALRPLYVYREEWEEVVRTPEWMLADRDRIGRIEGDCDDISTLFAAVAVIYGYRVRFVAIRYSRTVSHFEHVFVEAWDGGAWRMVDLTLEVGTEIQALEVMQQGV